ncbi:adenosine deaminase family protein-like protein [Rhexocercosporidium sp. MPI-PUGE-AT-0058]|nr:adenosine deaminase family protein-like protein [Rhexocercosporidium sp. MPI-PUGE-AT-0058]
MSHSKASLLQTSHPTSTYKSHNFALTIPPTTLTQTMDHQGAENQDRVQTFFGNRSELISREKQQRSDFQFRQSLSPTAQKACSIVSKIRLQEHEMIWSRRTPLPNSNSTEVIPLDFSSQKSETSEELFPGMIFNSAKNHMESTQLWKIVQRMPKGALLHCHLGAMVDLEWLFEQAVQTSGMFVSASEALSDAEVRGRPDVNVKIEFSANCVREKSEEKEEGIWEVGYEALKKVPLKNAAETFPDGGKAGFLRWMKDRCSVTQSEAVQNHLGVDDIWKKLQSAFVTITPIVYYEPITRKFLRKFLQTAYADGIRWVEMRGMTRSFRLEGEDELVENRLQLVRVFREEIDAFKASEEGKGFWGCRLIWDTLRSFDDEAIITDMKLCMTAKKLYPTLISGYDLVGPEDHGRTLHSLTPVLVWFQAQLNKENLNIPYFLHAGECVGDGDSTDQNLYDAILFKTRRIGHAFSLYKHPLLIDMVKEKQILVESCPISNEVLRYTASIKMHPLPALLARGVKAAISNDDPALMGQGSAALAHDFWQALQGWDNLGLAGLGSLAQNSVCWSAFEDQSDAEWVEDVAKGVNGTGIRAQRIKQWNAEWEEFCGWIVKEFGDVK